MRGTFANVRLRNLLVPGSEGTWTVHLPSGEEMTIFDASQRYLAEGVPLIVLAGKEYGSGSSRDWAAKGPKLLGVTAVIAESYERIHRSNLLMMGILPLQYRDGESRETLGLTGREEFSIVGVENGEAREVTVRADEREFRAIVRLDTPREREYLQHGGILPTCCASSLAGSVSATAGTLRASPERRRAVRFRREHERGRPRHHAGAGKAPRALGALDTGLLWGNLGVSLLVVVAGAVLVPALSLPDALLAIAIGCVIGNLMLATAGAMGAQARVPAMVMLRAPLGTRGSYIPTTVNLMQCIGWTVFELLVIATAAAALSDELFGFGAQWLWTLVFGCLALAPRPARAGRSGATRGAYGRRVGRAAGARLPGVVGARRGRSPGRVGRAGRGRAVRVAGSGHRRRRDGLLGPARRRLHAVLPQPA